MRFPFPGDWLTLFPVAEGERVSDQMHYAGLNLGLRENRGDGFWKTFQPVDDRDQNILYPAVFELLHDR
jgi:hypothetical protein